VNVQREVAALAIADRLLAVAVDPEVVARIELQACRALWRTGDCAQMQRRASAALTLGALSAVTRARLSSAQALATCRTAPAAIAETSAKEALVEGNRLGDKHSQRLAIVALIELARNEGRHRLALDRFNDLRRVSDSMYQAEEIRTLQHLDRYDDAEAMLAKIRDDQDGLDKLLPSMLYAQMWQDHDLARFDAAEAGARTLLTLAEETGNLRYRLNARMVLAAVATYRGEPAQAAELLLPVGEPSSSERRSPRLTLMQGWLKAGAGDLEGSLAILGPLLDGGDEFRAPWPWSPPRMRILASIGLAAGKREFAKKAADIADLVVQRNPGVPTLAGTALHIHALMAGDPGVLADAVRVLRESPRPLVLADALKDFGSMLFVEHRPEEAVEALVEAAELHRRAGAISSGRAIASLLRSQGIRGVRLSQPVPRPPTGWGALTPTELRVVDLIVAGHTNRSAAGQLGVSANTVNTHLRAVFRKLDVKSRVQLTIAWRSRSVDEASRAGKWA
jgi:DNA-binding CsgD family transcriptional regulator/tetratricopeptide (TPR) repeat protein